MRRLVSVAALAAAAVALTASAWAPAWAQSAAAEKRVALVIGNSVYKAAPLRNPVNDARAMAAALRQLGFKVIALENATKPQMERGVGEFGDTLAAGGIGLFYYAGHGLQVNGHNFLVPVDASFTTEARARLESLDVDLVLDQMAASGTDVNLVVLDACRNNPFERRFRGAGAGLAQINAPKGTLIAYATAPGRVAADGEGAHGVYTEKLLAAMKTPGLPIEEVFKRVRVDVSRATRDEQTPWEASSLTGSFFFVAPPAPPAPSPLTTEDAVWGFVKELSDPALFQAFLEKYPRGANAAKAELKLAALQKTQKAPPPAPAPVVAAAPTAPAAPRASVAPPVVASAPTAPAASPPPAPDTKDALWENMLWHKADTSNTPEAFQEYLVRYPNGLFAAEATLRLDRLRAAKDKTQVAAAPVAGAAQRPAVPGGSVDGIWYGIYSCSMSPRTGANPFTSSSIGFAVKNGVLSGKYEGQLISQEYTGSIAPGGKVIINGSGEEMRMGRSFTMSFEGKEEGGRFMARGRHADRDCTLTYSRIQ